MNHIESAARTQRIVWAERDFKIVTLFDQPAKERFRKAALAYYQLCEKRPGENRCYLAILAGSFAFEAPIKELRSVDRSGKLANIRQQLMAFSRVVSQGSEVPNSLHGIGRAFRRDHSTVVYAVKKYGKAVSEALQCKS